VDEVVSGFAGLSLESDASLLSPPDSAAAAAFVLDPVDRSFFAQPVPLKWTAGAANALRIVPSAPHDGQNAGPSSLMP
jgi:hypothetical protein